MNTDKTRAQERIKFTKPLLELGLSPAQAEQISNFLLKSLKNDNNYDKRFELWENIRPLLPDHRSPKAFQIHLWVYKTLFPDYLRIPRPLWKPTQEEIQASNIEYLRKQINKKYPSHNIKTYSELHRWSYEHYPEFWEIMTKILNIHFFQPYSNIVNLEKGYEAPQWFHKAKMNIVASCFTDNPQRTAIISENGAGQLITLSYRELDIVSNQIAAKLRKLFQKKDKLALIMPMSILSVALYLAIIKAGMIVVSIADSFAADEIKTRLEISKTQAIFTQDYILGNMKQIPLYSRVAKAAEERPIYLISQEEAELPSHAKIQNSLPNSNEKFDKSKKEAKNEVGNFKIRQIDHWFSEVFDRFLETSDASTSFEMSLCDPNEHINILFSSGTTGIPKAIPWNHTTGIKASTDAYLHLNLKPDDIYSWHTNLGWMMGPWLIFATLINKATLALYPGSPNETAFGNFIEHAKVTHLGVIPSFVKNWKLSGCMESCQWSSLKLMSSTGECSNTLDMFYLMFLTGYRPIFEYCGGTEIGGGLYYR